MAASPAELEHLLDHRFEKPHLLTLALTHRSFVYDAGTTDATDPADPSQDNEQLEFLGDAVLGLLAAEALCQRFPNLREGELTRLRALVVSRRHLGTVGMRLDLGRWLRLGRTAEQGQGRSNAALAANAVEALIAALYLDGGLAAARQFVERHVLSRALAEFERSAGGDGDFSGAVGDYKSALQEMLQGEGQPAPQYRLVEETGPDHRRLFRVAVHLAGTGEPLGEGVGPTKKQAQQEAARLATAELRARAALTGRAHG